MINTSATGTRLRAVLALAVVTTAVSVGAAAPAANALCCTPPATYGAYGFGANNLGQVGNATTASIQSSPAQVYGITTTAKQLAAGGDHSVLLKSDGTVAGWGDNAHGEVGDGTTTFRTAPTTVGITGVTKVSAGTSHTLALRSDGTVWAWGDNANGQLGDGTTTDRATPTQVHNLSGIIAIAAGGDFSLALSSSGTVYAWGADNARQMGDTGSTTNQVLPAAVPLLSGVTAIAAGSDFAFAVKSNGSVWAWGEATLGQLGDGSSAPQNSPVVVTGLTGIISVAAGFDHGVALGSNGSVWTWGHNDFGQLGNGSTSPSFVATLAIAAPGAGSPKVTQISAGNYDTLARTSDQRAIGWGRDTYGEFGTGAGFSAFTPVSIPLAYVQQVAAGGRHTLVMVTTTVGTQP